MKQIAIHSPILRRSGDRRARGFTLIEVLATMTFIAIVLPVAMQGITVATHTASYAGRTAQATLLAQSKLDEMIAGLQQNVTDGDDEENGLFHITGEIMAVDPTSLGLALDQITVAVTWDDRGTQRQVRLSTFVYQPGAAR